MSKGIGLIYIRVKRGRHGSSLHLCQKVKGIGPIYFVKGVDMSDLDESLKISIRWVPSSHSLFGESTGNATQK